MTCLLAPSHARTPSRLGLALLITLAAALAAPRPALADRGTARLRSGGIVSGHIEIYEPGVRIVIRTASGEVLALDIHDLVELEIVPEFTGVAPTPSPAPVAPQAAPPDEPRGPDQTTTYIVVPDYRTGGTAYAPAPPPTYQLQQAPDASRPGRRPSLFWPLMTLSGSAAAFISGTMLLMEGLYTCDSYYYGSSCSNWSGGVIGGATLMGLSLPLFVISAAYLLPRKVRARRRHRRALRNYQMSLAPVANPRDGHYGVGATLQF